MGALKPRFDLVVILEDGQPVAYLDGKRVEGKWHMTFERGYRSDAERQADQATSD